MAEYKGVLILGEVEDKAISTTTCELLGIGRKLADDLGEELSALILGSELNNRRRLENLRVPQSLFAEKIVHPFVGLAAEETGGIGSPIWLLRPLEDRTGHQVSACYLQHVFLIQGQQFAACRQ